MLQSEDFIDLVLIHGCKRKEKSVLPKVQPSDRVVLKKRKKQNRCGSDALPQNVTRKYQLMSGKVFLLI